MKITEILNESVDFDVCTIDDKYISPVGARQDIDCDICDGKGENTYPNHANQGGGTYTEPCGLCNGTGKLDRFVPEGPHMNLSNGNAFDLLRHLGLHEEDEYTGHVEGKDLPKLRQRLIKMLNSEKDQAGMAKDTTDSQGDMGATGSSGNVTSIGHKGPRMVDMGRTPEQIKRYAKVLLDMVEYAMKRDCVVSWG